MITLSELIGSEFIAMMQYEIASHSVEGTDYDSCKTEFKQHADEEREHMNTLMDCAIQRGITLDQDLMSLINNANPIYELMSESDSEYLVDFHIKAEEGAIKLYKQYYNQIKDEDITLANTIKQILADEIEHRTDLVKIMSSINKAKLNDYNVNDIKVMFSKLSKINKKIKESL